MQTGLISFEVIARINQLDIDLRAVVREYGLDNTEISKEELLRIAKRFEFKSKLKTLSLDKIPDKYPLPAIFILKDKSFGVLLKINKDAKDALIFIPTEKETKKLSFEEFNALSTGELIILTHKTFNSQIMFGFKWFYAEILKFKQVISEVLLGSFVVQLFGLVTPLFTQVILDKVIVHRSLMTLDVLAIAFVAVTIFEFLLNITRNYIFIHTANKIDAKLGAKLFKHLFSLPYVYFENRQVGNIIARVRELDTIREFITNKSVSVIIDLLFSTVFLVVMFLYSVKLTLIVLTFIFLVAILYLIVTPELRERLNYKFQMAAQSNSYLVESVTGIQTVKSLAIEGSMQKKWEDYLADYVKSSFKLSVMGTFTGAISNFFQKFMTIAILFFGVKLVISNKMSIGQLIAFQMFANQFTNPVLRLVNLWNEFQQALLGVDRLGDILNHPVEIQSDKAITLPHLNGAVKIDNLSFKYLPDAPMVLKNVSFEVAPGMSVGLVGKSGSGKSTITKLIQRLYFASEGAVYLDGIDTRHMNPIWLRNNIGIVLQENFLFSGTIRENIVLPKPDAPFELILEASKIAGAHDFISRFPEGYDTIVGERGSTLSGGQKQRIAIARALITNPRILIFDEATSALDYESENIILRNLNTIKQGRTTFIIAHRLSTVKNCDFIVALDDGNVIEIGTHSALLEKRGYYYNLHNQQEINNA
jgi:subfamily B ATP-binding cassette protein HlyB/CyaB